MAGPTLRLNLDAMGVKQGARDVDAAFNKIKQGAASTEASVNKTGSAISRMGKMSGQQRFVFQNTANQLGDIAVQASMGTNIFRVLGQQIPQIAGGFAILGGAIGPVAAILSVVAAVGFPIIAMFTSMGDRASTTADQVNRLRDAMDKADATMKFLSESTDTLEDRFGRAAHAAREFMMLQAQLNMRELAKETREAVKQLSELAFSMVQTGGRDTRMGMRLLSGQMQQLRDEFGLSREEALDLQDAFRRVGRATKFEEMQAASVALKDKMIALGVTLTETESDALANFTQSLIDYNIEAETARKLSEDLAASILNIGASAPLRLPDPESVLMDMPVTQDRDAAREAYNAGELRRLAERQRAQKEAAAALKREQDNLRKVAEQYKPAMTAAQEYSNVMKDLDKAFKIGAISQQEYGIATAEATRQYQIATGAAIDFDSVATTLANGLSNSLMSLVDGTKSASDAFKDMARQVIAELYRVLVVQQLVNAAMGAFGFSPAAGGGFTRTPVTGQGAFGGPVGAGNGIVVGERGPEVFYPAMNGTIVPNDAANGNVVVHQNFNFSANGDETVKQLIAQAAPKIASMTQTAIMDARRRGGQMKQVFG